MLGVQFESGVAGIFVFVVLALLIAAAWGTIGIWIALRTGSGEAVQAQFPILFFFIIVSSMNLPRNLIEAHWFEIAATLNPVSYMIEGLRSLVIEGWNARGARCSASASRSPPSRSRCCSRASR